MLYIQNKKKITKKIAESKEYYGCRPLNTLTFEYLNKLNYLCLLENDIEHFYSNTNIYLQSLMKIPDCTIFH